MEKISLIIDTLKIALKNKGIRYKDLADALDISEAALKRCFSEEKFTLERLLAICDVIQVDFHELVRQAFSNKRQLPNKLSLAQEKLLASDRKLLILFYLLINHWTVQEFTQKFKLSLPEAIQLLIKLEKHGLIRLEPNNVVKLLTARQIIWKKNGPVRAKFEKMIMVEFFNHEFSGTDEAMMLETGELSKYSIALINKKLDDFTDYFHELVARDMSLPIDEKKSFAILLGMRKWVFSLFEEQKNKS